MIGTGVWLLLKSGPDPEEKERRRRIEVNRVGRVFEGSLIDARSTILYYVYEIRGVGYSTSQDVSAFLEALPADLTSLIGHAGVKYDPKNPANSIVICEEWSGLRPRNLSDSKQVLDRK